MVVVAAAVVVMMLFLYFCNIRVPPPDFINGSVSLQPSKQQDVQMDEEESPPAAQPTDQSPTKSVPAALGNPVGTSSPIKEAPVKEEHPSDDDEEEEEVEDDSVVADQSADQSVLDTDV